MRVAERGGGDGDGDAIGVKEVKFGEGAIP
jgi:hypothetical protein